MSKKQLNVVASAGRVVALYATYRDQAQQSSSYLLILFALLLTSCGTQTPSVPLPQSTQESVPIKASIQIVTSTPAGKFIVDSVPSALRKQVEDLNVHLDISASPTQQSQSNERQIQWVYALVAPFPTVTDGVTLDDLKLAWT